jgi:hypothetical protein
LVNARAHRSLLRKIGITVSIAVVTVGLTRVHDGGAAAAASMVTSSVAQATPFFIEKAVHFQTTAGTDAVLDSGSYGVEALASSLRVRSVGGQTIDLAASVAIHDTQLEAARALMVAMSDDEQHLVLLLPGGKRLEAIGSLSGLRSRGVARPNLVSSPALQAAVATRTDMMRAPPPPVLLTPAPLPPKALQLPNPVGLTAADRGGGYIGLAWQAVSGAVLYRVDGTGMPAAGNVAPDTSVAYLVPAGPGFWTVTAIYPSNLVGNGPVPGASAVVRVLPPHSTFWLTKPNGVGLPPQVQTPKHQDFNEADVVGTATGNSSGDLLPFYDGVYAQWLGQPYVWYPGLDGIAGFWSFRPDPGSAPPCGVMDNIYAGCARPGLKVWLDTNAALWDEPAQAANEAIYGNAGDLGVGRRTYCEQKLRGPPVPGFYTVCYATAHGANAIQPGFNDLFAITHPVAGTVGDFILSMVIVKDASGTVFMAFAKNGKYVELTNVQLDSEAQKQLPFVCLSCHGGVYNAGTRKVDGASLLPLDPQLLAFSNAADQAAQEEKFRQINLMIYNSNPQSPIGAYILGLYNGALGQSGAKATPDFVPAGWAPQAGFYRQIVRPYCVLCHLATDPSKDLNFASWSNFSQPGNAGQIRSAVCALHTMPHNELQFKAFWTKDTGNLYLPGLLAFTLNFQSCG